jgi:hypothetical protein
VHLQLALNLLAWTQLVAGELTAAARLIEEDRLMIEEDRLIAVATGNPPIAYSAMALAAWRGQEAQAHDLIEATSRAATARGQGRLVSFAECASSVLNNGLGRHHAARDAAWRVFERDQLGHGPFVVPELAEAASRTGEVALVRAALEWLSGRTRVTPTDWSLGIEARVRALLSEGVTAESLYRESIARLGHMTARLIPLERLITRGFARSTVSLDARHHGGDLFTAESRRRPPGSQPRSSRRGCVRRGALRAVRAPARPART